MIDRLEELVRRALRVPPPPDPPAGSPGSTRVFRAARGFFVWRLIQWGLAQLGAFGGVLIGLTAGSFLPDFLAHYVELFEGFALVLIALGLLATFLVILFDYRLRWYFVTDRSLRIREGIFQVREQTVSFANIQNVGVKQGPVQRLLGIADVEIRTAGGGEGDSSGQGANMHRAVFRGVDNAGEIRDLIRNDLRRLRQDGRGELVADEAPADQLLAASGRLAAAAHELRAALRTAEGKT